MIRSTIRTETRDIIGEDSADFWTDAELDRYIDEAQTRFLNEERWPWLVTEGEATLLASDPDLELTEGVAMTRHLNITLIGSGTTNRYQPTRVSPAVGFQLRNGYQTTSQYPSHFYVTSVADDDNDGKFITVVKFSPTPVSEMDVEFQYYRSGIVMDADADSPDLPVEYHKALVHYAAGTAWLKELNGEAKAGEQFQMYAGVVEQARGEWLTETDDAPLVMGKDPMRSIHNDPWMLRIGETLGP